LREYGRLLKRDILCQYFSGSRLRHQGRSPPILEAGGSPKTSVPYQTTHPIRLPFLYSAPSESEISSNLLHVCYLFFFLFGPKIFLFILFKNSSIIKMFFRQCSLFTCFGFLYLKSPRSSTNSADLTTPTPYKSHLCCIRTDASSSPALQLHASAVTVLTFASAKFERLPRRK
jgi:hypothetical protein